MTPAGAGRRTAGHGRPRPLRILIVEDDVDSRKLIQRAVNESFPEAALEWASDARGARRASFCSPGR